MKTFLTLFAALAIAACGGAEKGGSGGSGAKEEEHAHAHGAHGGEVADLAPPGAAEEGEVETKLDHAAGTVTLWAVGPGGNEMTFDEPPVLNFVSDQGPVSVRGTKDGDGWVFRHDALKGETENARFRLKAGGKTYTPELTHHH